MIVVAAVCLAMMKKPVGEYRTPTDLWAGLGFSKSMPDAEVRDWLDKSLCYRGSGMSTTYEVGTRLTDCCYFDARCKRYKVWKRCS